MIRIRMSNWIYKCMHICSSQPIRRTSLTSDDEQDEENDAHDLVAELEVLAGLHDDLEQEHDQVEEVGEDEEGLDGVAAVVDVTPVVAPSTPIVVFPIIIVVEVIARIKAAEAVGGQRHRVDVDGERCEDQRSFAVIHRRRKPLLIEYSTSLSAAS